MPKFDDVNVGDELPTLDKSPDRAQLVLYCAGSGDFNPLHWDQSFEQAKQIGDNIVHGRLKYAALGQLVSDWLEGTGRVVSISARYRGMDRRAETFTCRGRVAGKREEGGQQLVDLDLWTENTRGERTTTGAATVVLDV